MPYEAIAERVLNGEVLRVETKRTNLLVDRLGLEMKPVKGFASLPITTIPATTPLWFQRRLAVLLTLSDEPPTGYVVGVGKRISKNVFWVEYNGDEDGNDTGKES